MNWIEFIGGVFVGIIISISISVVTLCISDSQRMTDFHGYEGGKDGDI